MLTYMFGQPDGVTYVVASSVTDRAGDLRVQNPLGSFIYDKTTPTSGIQLPVNGATYSSLPTISGTGGDNLMVDTVTLVVQDQMAPANSRSSRIRNVLPASIRSIGRVRL